MKLRYRLQDFARLVHEFFQDQWFDRTRHVRTAGNVSLTRAGIAQPADSEIYVPARPWQVRLALASLSLADAADYTYVDLGSGKGRTLFIAAELPFREVIGVEFSPLLHEQARANIRTYRSRHRRCGPIRSIHINATCFGFPDGPLVLYLFNPFGAETMRQVFDNLAVSLQQHPRHVMVVLLWPRHGEQVAAVPGMRPKPILERSPWLQVFEASPSEPAAIPSEPVLDTHGSTANS